MLQGGEQPNTKLFISYSSKDMAFGGRLEEALKTRGIELVIDRSEIYDAQHDGQPVVCAENLVRLI